MDGLESEEVFSEVEVAKDEKRAALVSEKDATNAVSGLENGNRRDIQSIEYLNNGGELSSIQTEDVAELIIGSTDTSPISVPRPDSVQLKWKSGKVSRSGIGCSKRPRMALSEDLSSQGGWDDEKEKTQIIRQRNNFSSKRGDKRNSRALAKNKFDPSSLKGGLLSFNSSPGGSDILGLYGLKFDVSDFMEHKEEISLNELLEGTHNYCSLGKDKGNDASSGNGNILHSIEKACLVLQPQKPLRSQHSAMTDSSSGRKMSPGQSGPVSFDKMQDTGRKSDTPTSILDFPLYQPGDVLERLALPSPKDLESLLLDATKPASSSRNVLDPRSGKSIAQRTCLPPFPWSHTFGGHCKTSSDTLKLCTNRSLCQGSRWTRIENTSSFLGVPNDCFTDLSTLVYDHSLVPSEELKSDFRKNENGLSALGAPYCEMGSSSRASGSNTSVVCPESGSNLKCRENASYSQSLLMAAQTLCDMVTQPPRDHPHGMARWLKKPSQKAMKARKVKYDQKSIDISPKAKLVIGSDKLVKCVDQMQPSKKSKLSLEDKKDLTNVNKVVKGSLAWSAPRSCRSSPSRSARDLVSGPKHYSGDYLKRQLMLPPPARVSDKGCNSQQKQRKPVPMN